jgi:hypothetical protein
MNTMAATVGDIRRWFETGVEKGVTHLIVICDTFDWEDFPAYVMADQDAREIVAKRNGKNMESVMEVYNLAMDKDAQLTPGTRVFNY